MICQLYIFKKELISKYVCQSFFGW